MNLKSARFIFHPLLFGLYPILALLASNLDQIRIETALRAGLVSLAGGALLYLLLRLALRDTSRAALLATLWLVLFYTYGHVYQLVEGQAAFGFVYGKHRYLALLWLGLLLGGSAWVVKKLKNALPLNQILNWVSVFLLVLPVFQIVQFELRLQRLSRQPAAVVEAAATQPGAQAETPDIYYIVLDGYSRADVLQDLYGLDNQPFMDELKRLGFVIPECSQSNYGITAFSMYASLNMDYLEALGKGFPFGSEADKVDYLAMREPLRHSQVRQVLSQHGYQMITAETGFWWLEVDDSDQFVVANNNPLVQYSDQYAVSNFEEMFLRTTALRIFSEANEGIFSQFTKQVRTPREHHYDVVKFALDELDKVPEMPGKKFVYFHILSPHDPFVFDLEGNYWTPTDDSDMPGYPNQVRYLNSRILAIVRNLIEKSERPPIIILQSDHGWDPRYRLEILNAYYLPDGGDRLVYPTITPVNTFRLILDHYFGEQYGLIEDRSYFSMGSDFPQYGIKSRPYQLTPVPGSCMND